MNTRAVIIRMIVFAAMMLMFVGCEIASSGSSGSSGSSKTNTHELHSNERAVTVFTARHYEADTTLFKAFTKQTGIEVIEVKGTAEELVESMKRDGESSEADLFFTVDGGVLTYAKQSGVLQPIHSDTIYDQVPSEWRDPDHYWVGVTTRARVIVYAKDKVRREDLTTYEQLTDDEWKGRVLVRSYSNLYNQSLLASFIALNGWIKLNSGQGEL